MTDIQALVAEMNKDPKIQQLRAKLTNVDEAYSKSLQHHVAQPDSDFEKFKDKTALEILKTKTGMLRYQMAAEIEAKNPSTSPSDVIKAVTRLETEVEDDRIRKIANPDNTQKRADGKITDYITDHPIDLKDLPVIPQSNAKARTR